MARVGLPRLGGAGPSETPIVSASVILAGGTLDLGAFAAAALVPFFGPLWT